MIMYNNLNELKSKNSELNQQIEKLEKERGILMTKDYIEKSKELYFKISELTTNEYQLYQYMGSEAPCIAPLLLMKNFPSNYSPF